MTSTQINANPETIAFCISYIRKEINKFKRKALEEISLNESERIDVDELKRQIVEDAISSLRLPEMNLPDGLIYESHLEHLEHEINESLFVINSSIQEVKQNSAKSKNDLNETIASLDKEFKESLTAYQASVAEELANTNVGISEAVSQLQRALQGLEEQLKTSYDQCNESLLKIANELNERLNQEKTSNQLEFESVKMTINSNRETFDKFKTDNFKVWELQDNINTSIQRDVKSVTERAEETSQRFSLFSEQVNQELRSSKERDEGLDQNIAAINQNKADREHSHNELATKDHMHPELATNQRVGDIQGRVENAIQILSSLGHNVENIKSDLRKKVDRNEALTDKDLDTLFERIRDAVLLSIPKPDDGKDAYEWEFKFHETQRGLLMYRREDWKHWRTQSLLGPVQRVEQPTMVTGGGGGGSSVTDTSFWFNEEEIKNPLVRMAYAVESDENGYFQLDTNVYDFIDEVFDIEANAKMLSDVSLTPVERKVDVQIEDIDANGVITGYTFCNRRILSAPGTQQYAVTEAPNVALIVSLLGK